MHRTTYEPCGHTVEHPDETPPEACPDCPPGPQTWDDRLEAIRRDLRWFAIECLKSDEPDCAAAFTAADIGVRHCISQLHDHGLADADYDRKGDEL